MKFQFKGFNHIAPRKSSLLGDGSFVYTVIFFVYNTADNNIISNTVEIGVPGDKTNADTDPFIMSQLMMRVNAMNNN